MYMTFEKDICIQVSILINKLFLLNKKLKLFL